jgi:hypothetical protein
MIKKIEKDYFIQEVDGQDYQIFYKDLKIIKDIISLPVINNKL